MRFSYNIALIEDCSHAHGAKYQNCHVGTFGDISVFSLHQRKNLPVGDGGICLMKDSNLRDKIFRLHVLLGMLSLVTIIV